MKVSKEETKKFYIDYIPCNCGDCKFLYDHFLEKYKDVFDYLLDLGVDPVKPIESMSYHDPILGKMVYSVYYLVSGEIEEDYLKKYGKVEISENFLDFPKPSINEPFFILSIANLEFDRTGTRDRHMTRNERIHVIRNCISKEDPMGLISGGCPIDEYIPEAKEIDRFLVVKRNYIGLWKIIKKVLDKSFSENIDEKVCKAIAYNISSSIDFSLFEKEMNEFDVLKGKIAFNDDYTIELKINDSFIVKTYYNFTYINNKYYYDIEEQDLLDAYLDFVTDDCIYIQYKHKHLFTTMFGIRLSYFNCIDRKKYSYEKLRHKNDIEIIFDIYGLLQEKE